MLDIEKIRKDFPILSREIYGRPLVYLDNGATTQKPLCVLDAMRDEYLNVNANVHRGVHWLSQQATDLHEAARETVRKFVNARSTSEIVFTRGTTESLNLVASSFVEGCMEEGDEVIVSTMEHHSNIVPWQLQQQRKNIRLRVIPMSDDGVLLLDEYEKLFSEKTKLVSVMHVSNVLGTVNPVKEIIRIAHSHGVPVMIDGAQSIPHMRVDVQDLDCEFLAFSGHKVYAPTGVGVLYGKEDARINDSLLSDEAPDHDVMAQIYRALRAMQRESGEPSFPFDAATIASRAMRILSREVRLPQVVFSELGLVEVDGQPCGCADQARIHVVDYEGKVELEDSVRYREGRNAQASFEEFKTWALSSPVSSMEERIRRPLTPGDGQGKGE